MPLTAKLWQLMVLFSTDIDRMAIYSVLQ